MADYEETHWHQTQLAIAKFLKKIEEAPADQQSAIALTEIAVQLMHANSHLEELTKATYENASSA